MCWSAKVPSYPPGEIVLVGDKMKIDIEVELIEQVEEVEHGETVAAD